MLGAFLIGVFGGVCAVLCVRYFDARAPRGENSLIDEIEIIEDF
jgi:hypothetical protein